MWAICHWSRIIRIDKHPYWSNRKNFYQSQFIHKLNQEVRRKQNIILLSINIINITNVAQILGQKKLLLLNGSKSVEMFCFAYIEIQVREWSYKHFSFKQFFDSGISLHYLLKNMSIFNPLLWVNLNFL